MFRKFTVNSFLIFGIYLVSSDVVFCTDMGDLPPTQACRVSIVNPPQINFDTMKIAVDVTTVALQPEGDGKFGVSQKVQKAWADIRRISSGPQEEKIEGRTIDGTYHHTEGSGFRTRAVPTHTCRVQRVYLTPTKANVMYGGKLVQEISYTHRREDFYHDNLKENELYKYFTKSRGGTLEWNGK